MFSRPEVSTPLLSLILMQVIPYAASSCAIARPAAPAPDIAMRTSEPLPVTRSALISPANTTIAVPCWSSWNTGMSSSAVSRRSISKQRGAEMSSRLMPPKPGVR